MKRKAFFLESKHPFPSTVCDKCGRMVRDVRDGKCFWNPNKRAEDKNICADCFDVFMEKRAAKYEKWAQASKALNESKLN